MGYPSPFGPRLERPGLANDGEAALWAGWYATVMRGTGLVARTRWYNNALVDVFSDTMADRLSDRLTRAAAAFWS